MDNLDLKGADPWRDPAPDLAEALGLTPLERGSPLMSPLIQSALIRAARTFGQVFLGVYLVGFIGDAANDATLQNVLDLAVIEKALVAGVVAVLTLLHRALLDPSPVPSLPDPVPEAGIRVR